VATSSNPNEFTNTANWSDAVAASTGYESPELISFYRDAMDSVKPWTKFTDHALNMMKVSERELILLTFFGFAIHGIQKKSIRVLDIGGGNGYMAHFIRAALSSIQFEWQILETENCAKAYQKFESVSEITWSYNWDYQEIFDITLFSCSLQYIENPFIRLNHSVKQTDWLVVMRAPLTKCPHDRTAIQRVTYDNRDFGWPCWFFSETNFHTQLDKLASRVISYDCLDESSIFEGEVVALQNFLYKTSD
jgi:putative methyltransferase (TIGR04325 family)